MTNRLCAHVIKQLADVRSFYSVAREVNLSVSTVIRLFDLVQYTPGKLPTVLSIDEFKGNTDKKNISASLLTLLTDGYWTYCTAGKSID